MPKSTKDFPEHINILTRAGTLEKLIAIAYFQGKAGKYAGPARNFLHTGIENFIKGLGAADRKRFNDILSNVQRTQALKKAIKED